MLGSKNAEAKGRLLRESKLSLKSTMNMCKDGEVSQKKQHKLQNSRQNMSKEVCFSKHNDERKSCVSSQKEIKHMAHKIDIQLHDSTNTMV